MINYDSSKNFRLAESRVNERGIALIVVLLFLIIIMILGLIAFKRSTTDLRVATASQISQLLFQANDAAFSKVEKEDRLKSSNNNIGGLDSLQGYVTRPGSQYNNAEIVFCVRPRSTELFRQDRITEKNADGNEINGLANGYCDVSNDDDFVNEGRVVTQMTFMKTGETEAGLPFGGEAKLDSSNDLQSTSGYNASICTSFDGYAVSILPSYSSASSSDINACLKKKIGEIQQCLSSLEVPFNIQKQTYKSMPGVVKCLG